MNNLQELEHVDCALCGNEDEEVLYDAYDKFCDFNQTYTVVRCNKCGLVYLNPRPSAQVKTCLYEDEYAFKPGQQAQVLEHYRPVIERINQAQPNKGKILDVGTGNSPFLPAMRDMGWEVFGTEVNPSLVEYCRTQLGVNMFEGELENTGFDNGSFDAITVMGVLEHVSNPKSTLEEVNRILSDNGVVGLWCFNRGLESRLLGRHWLGFDAPRHYYSFSRKTLSRLLLETGFEPFDWYHRPHSSLAITSIWATRKLKNRLMKTKTPVHTLRIPASLRLFFLPVGKALAGMKSTSDVYVFARKVS